MKLSLYRSLGAVHVRAGKLVTVAHDHQVATNTQSTQEPSQWRKPFTDKWVTATVGDLAVEIIAVATGKQIGYGYISGEPEQLLLYRSDAPPHWFSPAVCLRADLSKLAPTADNMSPEDFFAGVMAMKFAPADVVVFEVQVAHKESIEQAMKAFSSTYPYVPDDMDVDVKDRGAHMIGAFTVKGESLFNKHRGGGLVHFQPPKHSSDWCSSGFIKGLLIEGQWPTFDPWERAQAAS